MTTIAELVAAAEPSRPRPIAGLLGRLRAQGRLATAGGPDPALAVSALTSDSRTVRPGALFVALRGAHADGHRFLAEVEATGAAAALVERRVDGVALPQIVVDDTRRALGAAAAWWYEDPSASLGIVGVTGTDGKTTTAFLALAALEAAGIPGGLVSTAATEIGSVREANLVHATTPEAPRLQALLRAMVAAGDRAAVVEATSHGLALERLSGIRFDVALLTNLSHEHLDFHRTIEAYRDAKLSLFERLAGDAADRPKSGLAWPRLGIVNADDPAAPSFEAATRTAGARLIAYGRYERADVRLLEATDEGRRLRVRYRAPSGEGTVVLRLSGRFNAHNALAVIALGEGLGLDPAAVRDGIESVDSVPGRMDWLDAGQPFSVVVDFAHTPAALAAALDALRPVAQVSGGGLIAVFGSAGERDVEKRALMGRVAGERCRLVVVTDEDPRGEDPESILDAIARGAEAAGKRRGTDLLLIADRASAIRAAVAGARPGDVVLLAGKGHETSIAYADHDLPWDERAQALAALADRGFGG